MTEGTAASPSAREAHDDARRALHPGSRGIELALLAAVTLALLLPGIGSRSLWNPDEPRYAEVAREMLATGEYALPHLNGEVYTQKPPLLFWSIAALASLRGELDEVAARLPSVLAATAAVLLVFALAGRLFDRPTAWLSAAVYLSSAKLQWQARVGQIDMLLGALVVLAVYCWVRGWQEDRPAWRFAFFFVAGIGTLAKGPVALLPALFGIVAFLWISDERAELRRLPIGRGLLLWALVVLAWLGPAIMRGGQAYFEQIVLRQNVTRYADPWHHHQPWHYYLTTALPADFAPWVLLVPAALLAWRDASPRERTALRFAACWAVATLVFFSLSPAKRTVYVFQMFPALALLVGGGLRVAARRARAYRHLLAWPLAGFGALLAFAPLAIPRAIERRPEIVATTPELPMLAAALVLALAAVLLASAWLLRLGRVGAGVAALATGFALTMTMAFAVVLPRFDVYKTVRPLADRLESEAPPGTPWTMYPRFDAQVVFYAGRFAEVTIGEAELHDWLARPGPRYLLIERDDQAKLARPLPDDLEMVEASANPDGYVLLRRGSAPTVAGTTSGSGLQSPDP